MNQALATTKNKTLTTWLAAVLGALGVHRFYLRGMGDQWGWLHVLATGAGLIGLVRMKALGLDDHTGWVMVPLLGFSIAAGCLTGIVIGLSKQEATLANERTTGLTIAGVVVALLIGATALLSSITVTFQYYFETFKIVAH